MAYAIFAFALVFFLIVGNVQIHTSSQTDQSSSISADHLATDMLRLAGAVSDKVR
jgi:hypothetical protein